MAKSNTCPSWQGLFIIFSTLTSLISQITTTNAEPEDPTSKFVQPLIQWFISKGGTFHPALEIRTADPDDPTSRLGIFSKEDIENNELLVSIPPAVLLTPGPDPPEDEYLDCVTMENLAKEMRLGDDSDFAPYVNYLRSQSPNQLPCMWSEGARDLLSEVLDGSLPPFRLMGPLTSWYDDCEGSDDPWEIHAALLVTQRSWDEVLIPVYDMMSHRNGRYLNTKINVSVGDVVESGNNIDVFASRNIKAGDEIYTSYNFCMDCGGRAQGYGTPEIFRDYGFVEQYPQRWIFHPHNRLSFDLHEEMNQDGSGSGNINVNWYRGQPSEVDIEFLEEELSRLHDFVQSDLELPHDDIPENELDTIKQYANTLINAMNLAIKDDKGDDYDFRECADGLGDCSISRWYDKLEEHPDELDYHEEICDEARTFDFSRYEDMEHFKSQYQDIRYFKSPKNRDTCFELDNIVQICGSYRPHYHEMVVHHTASFVEDVKRVVWVGGGDSMLLHEIVKYPSLELVIGLELDQKVTRHSFKHFGTQPHWDNPKVQWWYGDASKSLLVLPKDYFGSFDMVLVDLSETVMSMSVTKGLDVIEALALLLKPDGIIVKNELYLEKFSQIFKYTVQAYIEDVPVICSQCLALGMNKLDLLYRDRKDHGIESLFYNAYNETNYRFEVFHDYRRKLSGVEEYFCKKGDEDDEESEPSEQDRSPGILMVLEVENTTFDLQSSAALKTELTNVLEKEGLTVISTLPPSNIGNISVIVTREAYIVARTWPEHNYCAVDIHMWSAFEKHEHLKKALSEALGSNKNSLSSFRIVAGGMFGADLWKNDEKLRGPRPTMFCDPLDETLREDAVDDGDVDIILEESMNLVQEENTLVAVVCGKQEEQCRSLGVINENDKVDEVVTLWTCPEMKEGTTFMQNASNIMFQCERSVFDILTEAVEDSKIIHAMVVDPSAPYEMVQIVHKIFDKARNALLLIDAKNFFLIVPMPEKDETWRRNFAETFRQDIITYDPVFRAEVLFNNTERSTEVAIVRSGDEEFMEHLVEVTTKIEQKTALVSDVRRIHGGLWNYWPDFKPTQFFLPDDYDQSSPYEQWMSQQPLGLQTVFQLEVPKRIEVTTSSLKESFLQTLSFMKSEDMSKAEVEEFADFGEGCVVGAVWPGGNVILVWDGRLHFDINIFTYEDSVETANEFSSHFLSRIPTLGIVLRDEQPRGYGRVVNYKRDLVERTDPHWL